jgi:hypothetical protein
LAIFLPPRRILGRPLRLFRGLPPDVFLCVLGCLRQFLTGSL